MTLQWLPVLAVVGVLAGCAGGTSGQGGSGQPSGAGQAPAHPSATQRALDRLATRCTEPKDRLSAFADFAVDDLAKHNIHETRLSVLRHLTQSIPAGQRVNCQSVAATYLVLREGH